MLTKDHNLQYKDVLIALLGDRCDIGGKLGAYENLPLFGGVICHF